MEEAGQNSVDPAAKQNAAAAAVAAPAAKPLRIKSFTLCDFRAFAGPEPVTFKLDGKNLLIYGENGAGKSSVFHALDEFFSVALTSPLERKRRLSELENIFPNIGKGNVSVRVLFEEAVDEIRWDENGHPADTKGYPVQPADPRVVKAAYRKAALDYRALLETNYRHGDGTVNLFDVCANVLLRDYPVVHNGSEWRLFDLWRRMQRLSQVLRMSYVEENEIKELSKSFNFGVAEALEALCPKVNSILKALGWVDVELTSFELGIVRFNWDRLRKNRVFLGRKITPKLRFLGKDLNKPQTFMNEARLSALALAIYFAGRQVCASTLQADTPRLMVLDDVLIGLDQSNRLPVLDVLADCFKDWQIILLTHDRTWFEMARAYQRRHRADKFWGYAKIHSNDDPTIAPVVSLVSSSAASDVLADGRNFLKQGHINAAGNYARIAVELALREFCETKRIPVAYQQSPDKTPASDLLAAAKHYSVTVGHGVYGQPLAAIEMYTSILFNKLSHGGVPAITSHEVQGALNAVDGLLFALKVVPTNAKAAKH